ncbi:MAG: response regulator [bacterium]|nr:response regulator [bacterium]
MTTAQRSRGTVLAVDDDPNALEAIASALGSLDYDVWRTVDAQVVLETAKRRQPDVILLDLVMPGLDGFEVCRRLKADPDTRLIPVVILTGQGGRDARIAGLDVGATDFLRKPCDLMELEVRVRNLVEFRHLTQELDSAEGMVLSIARLVEARDEGTGEHCERLASMVKSLGRRLGMEDDEVVALERGGYLHDIGKVGIPDAVLLKPGRFTEDEWRIMKRHVEIGNEICSPLRTLRPVLPIIRHHHERLDGSGYPDGLRGDEVPFMARVFQVVDIFDALTNDRPYRAALSDQDALRTLEEEKERGWWDPTVVNVFRSMIEENISRAS